MSRDPYDVLGVPGTASEAEIRRAFRALAKRYHPDVNRGDPDAARTFAEATNAAETLLDPRRRASYDESRTPGAPAGPATAAPEPPPSPGTSQAARTPPPTAPAPVSQRPGDLLRSAVKAVMAVAVIAAIAGLAVAPASRGSLCASGSEGDLASIQVTHDDGSSLTVNITVWEYV